MTENSVGPRSENSSQALAVKRKTGVPDRENATVKAVQATGPDRVEHSAARVPQWPNQLTNRNDSMLALREIRKTMRHKVRRSFALHSGPKVRRTLFLPPAATQVAAASTKKAAGPRTGGFSETLVRWS